MAHPGEVDIPPPHVPHVDELSLTSDMLRSSVSSPPPAPAAATTTHPSAPPEAESEPPNAPKHSKSNSVHPMDTSSSAINAREGDGGGGGQISDLLSMLECPVCMDTADRPPIYQCPEGHLLCEDCNSRLVDCPQCGHALMNSRNRTAEELAEKLQSLRGKRRGEVPSGQALAISVSEPQKVRKGFFAHVVYRINTKVGQPQYEDMETAPNVSSYNVSRRYSEIVNLYNKLVKDYQSGGIIVPPPPSKNRLAFVAVKLGTSSDLTESVASHVFEKQCVALDRYLKRLAKHPTLRKDPNFRAFIQEKDVPKALSKSKGFGDTMTDLKERMSVFQTRFTVTEHDPWFQTRQAQLSQLSDRVKDMQVNLRDMAELKAKLVEATDAFQRGLVSMTVSRENNLGHIIGEVVDCHKTMAVIHQEQSRADDLVVQLAIDYERLVTAAKDVLALRRKYQQQMHKVQKGKNPLEAIEKIQKEFDILSQTIRRELEHFDFVMKDEFEEVFSAYNSQYWHSLSKTVKAKA